MLFGEIEEFEQLARIFPFFSRFRDINIITISNYSMFYSFAYHELKDSYVIHQTDDDDLIYYPDWDDIDDEWNRIVTTEYSKFPYAVCVHTSLDTKCKYPNGFIDSLTTEQKYNCKLLVEVINKCIQYNADNNPLWDEKYDHLISLIPALNAYIISPLTLDVLHNIWRCVALNELSKSNIYRGYLQEKDGVYEFDFTIFPNLSSENKIWDWLTTFDDEKTFPPIALYVLNLGGIVNKQMKKFDSPLKELLKWLNTSAIKQGVKEDNTEHLKSLEEDDLIDQQLPDTIYNISIIISSDTPRLCSYDYRVNPDDKEEMIAELKFE
jgi:hypothetical protein